MQQPNQTKLLPSDTSQETDAYKGAKLSAEALIIGAGPAGLAMAAHLHKQQIPYVMIEKSRHIGNAWREHYDRLHLHTVKTYSHLPFLPFPEHYPTYVPKDMLVQYMEDYARQFDIRPMLGEEAVSIEKQGQHWRIQTSSDRDILVKKVILATGVNAVPNRPVFPGEENYHGVILHSKDYRNAQPFRGQSVLVVGMGNSGAEIALDLCENGADTWLSVRGPVNIVPRDVLGRPTQLTAMKLAKLPVWLGDRIGVLVRALTTGNLERYGIQSPRIPPAQQLRQTGKTPVVDIGAVQLIKQGRIRVAPGIKHFTAQGVECMDGRTLPFDAVILATGYKPGIRYLLRNTEGLLDAFDLPVSCIGEGAYAGLYFLGFDNYTAGGILGVIQRDSARIVQHITDHAERST